MSSQPFPFKEFDERKANQGSVTHHSRDWLYFKGLKQWARKTQSAYRVGFYGSPNARLDNFHHFTFIASVAVSTWFSKLNNIPPAVSPSQLIKEPK
jgi:hypothetical protein